ncbi:ORAI2 [Bugula neritina]|uniref:ORAI2 n=1 Tax=Bugula neritina TaxID=10212 RepID=A0A7J7KCJ2_BUGNE|nr:ORAI2 [Bugula neritina]
MIGIVEITLSDQTNSTLLVLYAVNTTLLVAVHILALMISTCILPNIESATYTMSSIQDSPHVSMNSYIQMAWVLSTAIGILLFLIEIAILCWVKFCPEGIGHCDEPSPAIAGTIIIIPAGIVFIAFTLHFYRKLARHQFDRTNRNLEELENIHSNLQSNII